MIFRYFLCSKCKLTPPFLSDESNIELKISIDLDIVLLKQQNLKIIFRSSLLTIIDRNVLFFFNSNTKLRT